MIIARTNFSRADGPQASSEIGPALAGWFGFALGTVAGGLVLRLRIQLCAVGWMRMWASNVVR